MLTKKELKLIRKYAKATKFDPKLVQRAYEKGDIIQRKIDITSMEATLYVLQAKKEGRITPDEKGVVSRESADKIYQEFLDMKKRKGEKLPKFFTTPLPVKMATKPAEQKTSTM